MIRVATYCGASLPKSAFIQRNVEEFGQIIGQKGWTLVYCGSNNGLMGLLAENALANKAQVFGIGTPVLPGEIWRSDLTSLEMAENMSSMKARMRDLADVIVVLPGGIGTLDEFFEAIALKSIGAFQKPLILWNLDGFWDQLMLLLGQLSSRGLIRSSISAYFTVVSTTSELVNSIEWYSSPYAQPTVLEQFEMPQEI